MTTVHFFEHDGTEHTVEGRAGRSLMRAAVDNDVPGIDAICRGCCSCSTCHCYIDDAWRERLPPATEAELGVLEGVSDRRPNSRLSCQIVVTEDLGGIVVRLPESQG
jgi:ferredoxin, 2Fe-2S